MPTRLPSLSLSLTLIAIGFAAMRSPVRAADVPLVAAGTVRASIVLPAEANATETDAAAELVDGLKRITGQELQVGQAPVAGLVPIHIGRAATFSGGVVPEREGTFELRVAADRIDIGGSGDGPYFGVCELLEQLGVRWLWPGDTGSVYPTRADAALALQTTRQEPAFTGRHFQMPGAEWQRRLRCGGPNFPGAHGVRGITGKDFAEHPEWFALIKGERKNAQLCVSNPEVIRVAIASTRDYFRKNPAATTLGMGPNDGANFCQCDSCRALDAEDYDPYSGEDSVTDRYVWFFNQVLAGIADEFPDKKIGFYVYHNYMRPPVREKPSPRITGALAPIALCRLHGPNNPVCPEKSYYEWLATEWGKLIPELWDRGYWSNLACPGFAFPLVHRIREQIPLGKRAGIFGWRVETFPHYAAQSPGLYIAARLMWNTEADVDALLADFYAAAYGPAAAPMAAYHTLLDHTMRDADYHTGSSWDFPHIYPPAMRAQAYAHLDAAAAAAPADSPEAARVAAMRANWDMTDAFCRMMDARVAADFATGRTQLDRLDAAAAQLSAVGLISDRNYPSYMKRFFRHATEQAAARASGGNTLVAVCPDEWDFLLDSAGVGEDTGWYRAGLRGMNWQRLKTSSLSWSDQGLRYYKGIAWYRSTVTVAPEHVGKRTFLWCGGVDEKAKVWINGTLIGVSHGAAIYPFEMDTADTLKAGENQITIAVANLRVNELGTGGILAPVILWSPADPEAKPENIRDTKPTFP